MFDFSEQDAHVAETADSRCGRGVARDLEIAIIDDDDAVRRALVLLVRACGWRSRSYGSVSEFLTDFESAQEPTLPDCLVLDLNMPGATGVDLQQELHRRRVQVPVIAVTGFLDHPLARRSLDAGAHRVLGKPVAESELKTAIIEATGD